MFKWLTTLFSKPIDVKAEEVADDNFYDSCVGEPVISFLESLKANPKRYRLREVCQSVVEENDDTFEEYEWHRGCTFYSLLDRKTGKTYYARNSYRHELGEVYDLPFSLNHWECLAITKAFQNLKEKVIIRRIRLHDLQTTRARLAREATQLAVRNEFAQQFRD